MRPLARLLLTILLTLAASSARAQISAERPVSTPFRTPDLAHPSLAWNGPEWLIAWEDQFRSRIVPHEPSFCYLISGAIRDVRERSAALVALGDGRVLASYTRVDNGTERVFIAMPHISRVRSSRTETP